MFQTVVQKVFNAFELKKVSHQSSIIQLRKAGFIQDMLPLQSMLTGNLEVLINDVNCVCVCVCTVGMWEGAGAGKLFIISDVSTITRHSEKKKTKHFLKSIPGFLQWDQTERGLYFKS